MKNRFFLNGKIYSKEELLNSLEIECSSDEQSHLNIFIQKWINDNQEYIEVSTSGSTGKPKIIKHSKQAMIASANATCNYFNLRTNQNALLCLPANKIGGMMMVVRAFTKDLNLITVKPSLNPLADLPKNITLDFAAMTPAQASYSLANGQDFNNVKTLIIGGGFVSNDLLNQLQSLTTDCFSTYGMTETISHIALQKLNGADKSNCYQVLDGISISADKNAQLCIEAPHLFYGKIITNDIVELTDNKHFKWLGRADNVINSGGIKHLPENIENQIHSLIDEDFFISSIPDTLLGEQLVLIIQSHKWATDKVTHLLSAINDILEKHKLPKKVLFIEKFIYTENGKIQRSKTLQQAINQ